jgi:hypothetical protein
MLYTDRSRQMTELTECVRKRWWKYHGVNGFGIDLRGTALEAQTGIIIHAILADILNEIALGGWVMPKLTLDGPARARIRQIIANRLQEYSDKVSKAGWLKSREEEREITAEDAERFMAEQIVLCEGLTWSWVRTALPLMIDEFTPVLVEQEEVLIEGCTCTVRDLQNWKAHEDQDCQGVCFQSRPDIVLRRRKDGQLGVHDFKTVKAYDDRSVESFKDNVQMASGTLAVERHLDEEVTHYYIHFLVRGDRRAMYQKETKAFDGPRMQQSDYCYVTWEEPDPPMHHGRIKAGAKGEPWYKRRPVWELEFPDKPKGVGNAEWVVELLGGEIIGANLAVVGPYDRPTALAESYVGQVVDNEYRWADRVYNVWADVTGAEERKPIPLAKALDANLPPSSWQCFQFGRKCAFYRICHGEVLPEKVMESGFYEYRVPHHLPELYAKEREAAGEIPEWVNLEGPTAAVKREKKKLPSNVVRMPQAIPTAKLGPTRRV